MDTASGFCIGCGRSLGEIARWSCFSDAERRLIMAGLRERLVKARLALAPTQHDEMT